MCARTHFEGDFGEDTNTYNWSESQKSQTFALFLCIRYIRRSSTHPCVSMAKFLLGCVFRKGKLGGKHRYSRKVLQGCACAKSNYNKTTIFFFFGKSCTPEKLHAVEKDLTVLRKVCVSKGDFGTYNLTIGRNHKITKITKSFFCYVCTLCMSFVHTASLCKEMQERCVLSDACAKISFLRYSFHSFLSWGLR